VLIGALGAADGNKTKRSHFIFEKGGKLVDRKLPVKPADRSVWFSHRFILPISSSMHSPRLALEFIQTLGSKAG
jgi:peroxiredoxin Q/BCP